LVRADGTAFASQDDCVSYAAENGTLTTRAQFDCESVGGTFSTDPTTDTFEFGTNPNFVWSCNNASANLSLSPVQADCLVDFGWAFAVRTEAPFNASCYKP